VCDCDFEEKEMNPTKTTGPWEMHPIFDGFEITEPDQGKVICTIYDRSKNPQAAANAVLIATCPAMYNALKELTKAATAAMEQKDFLGLHRARYRAEKVLLEAEVPYKEKEDDPPG
jgi:hypothetical protein